MLRRPLVMLLFCVALLAQLAGPVARGVAMAQSGASASQGFVVLCKLLHGDEDGDRKGSGKSLRHDHSCSLCQIGAHVAPVLPQQAPSLARNLGVVRAAAIVRNDRLAARLFTRGPPARGPPAFA